ncbi:DUF6279 family lipoprotein [Pseudomonas oryzae]|uniref:Lipoprotein n=1 Tax=Pseudomonas oryzae TaxID=1392877 RepID=A0A1H1U840_9PSED|nr:DUF6279 family lipoprotein [Pseudomonas oryzae]SDS68662.1 hypothetical protein SAMN05216221_2377 [Pseudomonas oryzae]
MSRLALFARSLGLLLVLLMLAACSRLELAYRNLDRLIEWKLDDYLSLDAAQSDWLEARLDAHLAWHCRHELPRYLDWLDRQRPLLAASPAPEQLEGPLAQTRQLLQPTLLQVAPDAARLLAGLSKAQIDELEGNLATEQRKLRERYLGGSREKRLAERMERAETRLEFWLGPLYPQQRAYLRFWASRQEANVRPWLDFRERWQAHLLAELRQSPPAERAARLQPLFGEPERYWGADYRRTLEHTQQILAELLSELWASATPAQRAHLMQRLDHLHEDLAGLPCAG